ncbi:response regulator transcription factor [Sphingomonas sp. 2378]|uniref:response regulator transcription factor n=1 Tax=Sphingomonas sp. 2378 TaxID=1219748 RepID=UPI00311B071A
MLELTPTPKSIEPGQIAQLTPREYQVLLAVGRTGTSKEIAIQLGISPKTVDKHAESASRKLGIRKRVEAGRALVAYHLRRKSVGESLPIQRAADPAFPSSGKGGSHAPPEPSAAERELGRSGGAVREPRGDTLSTGGDMLVNHIDAGTGPLLVEAGFAPRDHQRRTGAVADRGSPLRLAMASWTVEAALLELVKVLGIAVLIGMLLTGALGFVGSTQIFLQQIDRQLTGR